MLARVIKAFTLLCVALTLFGCGGEVNGTYRKEGTDREITLSKEGRMFFHGTGDVAEYTVEGNVIIVGSWAGGAQGEVSGSKLVFPKANGIVAKSLAGTWVKKGSSEPRTAAQPAPEENVQNTQTTNQNPPYGVAFSLVNQNGETITDSAFREKPTVLFFGFTHCPDVCPTTLFEMDAWLRRIDPNADQINAYFVTVDPERDSYEILGSYISNVSDRIIGISGDPQLVHQMVKGFDVYAKKIPLDNGDYIIDHTASIFLLGDGGQFQGTISYGEDANAAVEKLKNLL